MALFDNLSSELKLDASDYLREAKKAERASKDLADETDNLSDTAEGSAKGTSRAKEAVGGLGVAAAGLAAGGLAKSISAATSFESSMADVQKVTSKGVAEKLKGNFQDLAETIPISQAELATLGEQAGKFGVQGSKNITKFVETVGQISSATDLTAEEAGTRFAKIAGAIGLPMSQISKLGNATNSLADSMKTDAGEITDTANRAGITLSQRLGLSKRSVLALSASMNEVSPSAQVAASSLKMAAEALMDPKKVGKIASALGMTKGEFTKIRDQQPQRAFDLVSKAMAKGGKRATALGQAVGKRPTRAFSALGQQVGRTHDAMKTVGGQFKNGTSLAKEMSIRTGTAAGKWQLFKNKLQNVAITTGNVLLPVLLKVLDPVSNAVSLFGDWNEKLGGIPAVVGLVATAVSGLAVAAGVFIGPMLEGVSLLARFASVAGMIASPIGIAITAIGLLGAAYATNFGGIRDITADVVGTIRQTFLPIFQQARALILPILAQIGNAFNTQGSRIQSVAGGLFEQIGGRLVPVIQRLGAIATSVITWIGSMWSTHGQSILSTISLISTNLSEMLIQGMAAVRSALDGDFTQMMGAFREFKAAALNIWGAVWPAIKRAAIVGLTAAWDWIKTSGVGLARSAFSKLTTVATTAFKFGRETLLPLVRDAIGAAWIWVRTSGVQLGKTALGLLGRGSLAAFKFGKQNLLPAVQSAIRFAWNWVKTSGVSLAKTALSLLATGAISAFKFGKQNLLPAVRGAIRSAWTWVRTTGVQLGKNALIALGKRAVAAFEFGKQNLLPKIRTAIRSAWTWVRTQGVTAAKNALKTLSTKALTAFKFGKTDILPKVQGGLRGAWQWARGPGTTQAKSALKSLSTKAKNAFDLGGGGKGGGLIAKARTGIQGVARWTRNQGATLAKQAFVTLVTKSANAFTSLKGTIQPKIRTALNSAVSWVKTRGLALFKGGFEAIGRGIGTTLSTILNGLPQLFAVAIPKIRTWLKNNGTSIIKGGFEAIGKGIRTFILGAFAIAGLVGQAVVSTITGIGTWLANGGATKLKNGFISIVSGIVSYLKNDAWGDLKGAAEFLFDAVMAAAEGLYDGLIGNSLIPDMFGEIASFIRNFDIFSAIDSLLSQVWKRFDKLKTDALNTVSNLLGTVIQNIQSWPIYQKINGVLTSVWQRFDKLKTDAQNTVKNMLSDIKSKAEGWVGKFKKPFKDATEWVNDKFSWLKKKVVGNSHVPDMLDDTVKAAGGSWARKFTKPFKNAADAIEKRLGKLRDRAGKLAGKVGGKAKKAVKSVGKALSGKRKMAEWAGERGKAIRNGLLRGMPKRLAGFMRKGYRQHKKLGGSKSWKSFVSAARSYGSMGGNKWREDTAAADRYHTLASGGMLRSDGFVYAHAGEQVVPADVDTPYSGGSSGSTTKKEVHHHHTTLKLDGEDFLAALESGMVRIVDGKLEAVQRDLEAKQTK